MSLGTTPAITATVPVPGAQYVVQSGDGSRLLVFSNNHNFVNTVTIVSPFNIVAFPGEMLRAGTSCAIAGVDSVLTVIRMAKADRFSQAINERPSCLTLFYSREGVPESYFGGWSS